MKEGKAGLGTKWGPVPKTMGLRPGQEKLPEGKSPLVATVPPTGATPVRFRERGSQREPGTRALCSLQPGLWPREILLAPGRLFPLAVRQEGFQSWGLALLHSKLAGPLPTHIAAFRIRPLLAYWSVTAREIQALRIPLLHAPICACKKDTIPVFQQHLSRCISTAI